MLELFKFIFAVCAGTCFAVVLFVVGMFGFWCIGNQVVYYFDKSICTATVNEEVVYQGRCHFITVNSVGENGNSKHLTIYKDAMNLRPLNHYIAENIKVSEK